MKAGPILLAFFICMIIFAQKTPTTPKFNKKIESKSEVQEIKRNIETMKAQIKVIKSVKKDMDEKEWKIEL